MSDLMTAIKKANRTAEPNECVTTHGLDFKVWEWNPNETPLAKFLGVTDMDTEYQGFLIGTCDGLWTSRPDAYVILAVVNEKPGNGHFEDVLEWFYHSCRRDRKHLVIEQLWNPKFRRHLMAKRGFLPLGDDDLIKPWQAMPE